jgi:uncharacterized membrane protein
MALWSVFIFLGLALLSLRNRKKMLTALSLSVFSALYFITVVGFIIPSLANGEREYLHLHYDALGGGFSEILNTVLTRPVYCLRLLFINHLNDPDAEGIKRELHMMVMLSGGIGLILRPQYLVMLIPVYAQKLFNDSYGKWGINVHYSIEFAPILSSALFAWLGSLRIGKKWKISIAVLFTLITLAATIKALDSRVSKWYIPEQNRFYQKDHYVRDFDVKNVYRSFRLIPGNAAVSAQSPLVPHLAFRDYIYQFPVINNAEYIILNLKDTKYPLTEEEFNTLIKELTTNGRWERIASPEPVLILKRKKK